MEVIKIKEITNELCENFYVIELLINEQNINDCYSFYSLDSASELKLMLLEEVSKSIDNIIINHKDYENYDKTDVIEKLGKIEIKYGSKV